LEKAFKNYVLPNAYASNYGTSKGDRLKQITEDQSLDFSTKSSIGSKSASVGNSRQIATAKADATSKSASASSQNLAKSSGQGGPSSATLNSGDGKSNNALDGNSEPNNLDKSKSKPTGSVNTEEKALNNPESLANFLKSEKPKEFDKKLSKISYIQRLIELRIQVIKIDGSKIGSKNPLKIIEYNKKLDRYVMRNVG
jgi:hypothetical protein